MASPPSGGGFILVVLRAGVSVHLEVLVGRVFVPVDLHVRHVSLLR